MPEAGAPGFDSPPSLALEEEFTASEADYSPATRLSDTVSREETMAEPARVTAAHEVDVEARAPSATGAEPTVESSAPAQTDAADEEAGSSAPAAPELARPRRSGWWQRARATVIGK
jgi:ribonuclease E